MKILTFLVVVLMVVNVNAQDTAPELITDRPDQTESSEVVPLRSLQIETGFLMANVSSNVKSYAYNTSLLRYGLLSNMEIRLGMDYLGDRVAMDGLDWSTSGFSPLYLGTKIRVAEENGWKPAVAFLAALNLPFTASKDYKPSYTAADMRLAFSHTLNDRLSLGYNLGAEWDGETANPAYNYSFSLGISLAAKLGMFVESYGAIPEEGEAEHLLDAGFTYLILPNFQVDCSGGFGIQNGVDNFISAGVTWRLPN